jgi:hypothetical protein
LDKDKTDNTDSSKAIKEEAEAQRNKNVKINKKKGKKAK